MFLHNTLVDRVEGADSSSVCVYSVPLVGLGGGGGRDPRASVGEVGLISRLTEN